MSCVAFSRNNDGRMQNVTANQKPWDGDRPELGKAGRARGAIESDGDRAESGVCAWIPAGRATTAGAGLL